MFLERGTGACRPVQQFATAIGTAVVQLLGTFCAEGAFEGADESTALISRKIGAAPFAIGSHLKHDCSSFRDSGAGDGVADSLDHALDLLRVVPFCHHADNRLRA